MCHSKENEPVLSKNDACHEADDFFQKFSKTLMKQTIQLLQKNQLELNLREQLIGTLGILKRFDID